MRVGFVIQQVLTLADLTTLQRANPGLLVFVAPLPGAETVRSLRAMFPACLFIYREPFTTEEQHAFLRDPNGARKAAERTFAKLNEHGTQDCFDLIYGLNEPVGPQERDAWDAYRLLDAFHVDFLAECRAHGKDAIAFNTGAGVLSGDEVREYFPRTVRCYRYYGLHVYDWPCLDSKDRNWLSLRHRYLKTLDALPDDAQVLVTELGLTHAVYGGADVGWRGGEKGGKTWPGIAEEEYERTIAWWVADVRQHDAKITHAALYLLNSPSKEWESFIHTGMGQWVGTLNADEPYPLPVQGGAMPSVIDMLNARFANRWQDLRAVLPANPANGVYPVRPWAGVRYHVAHHVGAVPLLGQSLKNLCVATANYHVKSNRWPGIGYHFVIHQNGEVGYVGDILTQRANVANMNHLVVGTCLQGNFVDGARPTAAQITSLRLLDQGLKELNSAIVLVGHKELNATACPGDTWDRWKQEVLSTVPGDWSLVVGEGIKTFLQNAPNHAWGGPARNAHWDTEGNEYCWTTTGNLVYWDKARNGISVYGKVA